MKNLILIALAVFGFHTVFAQYPENSIPPYKSNPNIPAFELDKVDRTKFSSSKIKKDTPAIIMFFSPQCEHCIQQYQDMVKRMNDLQKYQIVMASYQPMEEIVIFDKAYEVNKHPNITIGRDSKYTLPPFYHIVNFPFLAFYGKDGKLKSVFEGNITVDNMIKRLK